MLPPVPDFVIDAVVAVVEGLLDELQAAAPNVSAARASGTPIRRRA